MIDLKLGHIASMVNGTLNSFADSETIINGVHFDSRKIREGNLFVALQGERDGHDFIQSAIDNGAAALLVSKKVALNYPQIIVKDTLFALGEFARKYRNLFDVKVIAISGSLGKTTTREMIVSVLKSNFNVVSSPANYNNLIGLPLSIFNMDNETDIAVFELGINQKNEMMRLCQISSPDIGVLTTIAPVHLELLETLENVAAEKTLLFDAVSKKNGKCYFLADDVILSESAEPYSDRLRSFSIDHESDFIAENIHHEKNGKFSFEIDGNKIDLKVSGRHNIYNALAAYAVSKDLSIDNESIINGLNSYHGFSGRMQIIEQDNWILINDAYNASPKSVRSAIETLKAFEGRKMVVLGDMLELGSNEVNYHREIIDLIERSEELFRAFLYGELYSKAIGNHDSKKISIYNSRSSLIKDLKKCVKSGDVLLVKGSLRMRLVEIVEEMNGET